MAPTWSILQIKYITRFTCIKILNTPYFNIKGLLQIKFADKTMKLYFGTKPAKAFMFIGINTPMNFDACVYNAH